MIEEVPKRLTPTKETIRELFGLSLNRCAYPDCSNNIINEKGVLLGEVCHIEAALPEGERFNKAMTNESRRHISNLVLLCAHHHNVTNDIVEFTVGKMKELKEQHENKSYQVINQLEYSFGKIKDLTVQSSGVLPKNIKKLAKFHNWDSSNADLLVYVAFAKEIISLPAHMKVTLGIVLKKMISNGEIHKSYFSIKWLILKNECGGITEQELFDRIKYLEAKDILVAERDEGVDRVLILDYKGENYINWFLEFCKNKKIDIGDVIVNGNFSFLDDSDTILPLIAHRNK